jgi:hypothetical protein
MPLDSFDRPLGCGATDLEKENFRPVWGGGVEEGDGVGVEC